jgi:hypothetical protein
VRNNSFPTCPIVEPHHFEPPFAQTEFKMTLPPPPSAPSLPRPSSAELCPHRPEPPPRCLTPFAPPPPDARHRPAAPGRRHPATSGRLPTPACLRPLRRRPTAPAYYVRNSNRRYRLKTRAKVIISNLKKQDTLAAPRSGTCPVESKKETICFSACLS